MKLREKRSIKYIRDGVKVIAAIIFILMMYVSILNISYRANTEQFVNGMNHTYKQEIKRFADNKVEQLELYTDYLKKTVNNLQQLLNHFIPLILKEEGTSEQIYDYLTRLSKQYPHGLIMIGDQETNQLQAVLVNGVFLTELEPLTLEGLTDDLDFYGMYEFNLDKKWIISGYGYQDILKVAKYAVLSQVQFDLIDSIQYTIIDVENLVGANSCGEVVYTTIKELDDFISKPLNCTSRKNIADYMFQEILQLIHEKGSGFTVIDWGEKQNNSLVYATYYPDYKWIITASAKETLDVPSSLTEFEQFKDMTKIQMNIAIIVACLSFFMALIGGWLVYKFVKLKEIEYERKRNRVVESHNRVLMSKNQKINQIVHDIKNHLICIKGLIGMDQSEQAMTYIDSVFQDIHQLSTLVITGDQFMDIILNEKINQMRAAGIMCYQEIEKINFTFMDKKDITILFTNLFDNAIESCERSQQKVIHFNLFTFNDGFIVIKVRNSCDIKPIDVKGNLQTTKGDTDHHGYGVSNIMAVVEKYKGETFWEYHEQKREFNFVITIPIPQS